MKSVESLKWEITEKKRAVSFWTGQKNTALYHIERRQTEIKDLENRIKTFGKCTCGHSAQKHHSNYGCQYVYPLGSTHDYQDGRGHCVCTEFYND